MRAPLPAIARLGLRSVPPAMVKLPVNMLEANGPLASCSFTAAVSASGVMSTMSVSAPRLLNACGSKFCTANSLIV